LRDGFDIADEAIAAPVLGAVERLGAAGADVVDVRLDEPLALYDSTYRTIMQSEAAAAHAGLFDGAREHYGDQMRSYVEVGRLIPAWVYLQAQRIRPRLREVFTRAVQAVDCIALPAVPTTPPPRESTGSSAHLSPISLLAAPAIALPCGFDADLPQSLQLVGAAGADDQMLEVAAWCAEVFGEVPTSPLGALS
jgi:aspartyl-tRNA(Asn)/glutamyl-tRNA(Gln) amidotransferase subunit A